MAKSVKTETIEEIKANLEAQLAKVDKAIEKAVSKVDKLTIQRAGLATLLEKVNRIDAEPTVA